MKNSDILKEYVLKNKFFVILIILSSIISTILTLIAPVFVGDVIEKIVTLDIQSIIKMIIIIACTYISIFIFDSISVINSSKLASKIGRKIREKLFNKLHKMPISYIDKNSHGEIVNKFSFDVENICLAIIRGCIQNCSRSSYNNRSNYYNDKIKLYYGNYNFFFCTSNVLYF